ncbi:hypothetical protein EV401DRAFT_1246580 [Pisolithus croceorrhizus]|nr:hypothetical protein EV401DRAFT_1246580 [Pisolithus croceorrhizus]
MPITSAKHIPRSGHVRSRAHQPLVDCQGTEATHLELFTRAFTVLHWKEKAHLSTILLYAYCTAFLNKEGTHPRASQVNEHSHLHQEQSKLKRRVWLAALEPCKATANCCLHVVTPAKPKQPKSSEGKSKRPPAMNKNAHKYNKHGQLNDNKEIAISGLIFNVLHTIIQSDMHSVVHEFLLCNPSVLFEVSEETVIQALK